METIAERMRTQMIELALKRQFNRGLILGFVVGIAVASMIVWIT